MPVRPFLKSNLPDSALSDKLAWHEKNVYRLINKFHFCLEREGSIVVILTLAYYMAVTPSDLRDEKLIQ